MNPAVCLFLGVHELRQFFRVVDEIQGQLNSGGVLFIQADAEGCGVTGAVDGFGQGCVACDFELFNDGFGLGAGFGVEGCGGGDLELLLGDGGLDGGFQKCVKSLWVFDSLKDLLKSHCKIGIQIINICYFSFTI